MTKIYVAHNPEQRIHINGVSVKFRGGVAEVSESVAAALLRRDGFSSEEGSAPSDAANSTTDDEVKERIAAEVARITETVNADAAEKVKAEVERLAADTEAKIEAEVKVRVAAALEQAGTTHIGDPDLSQMDEAQLRALAEVEGIELGKLQNVDKIRDKIAAELDD